MRQILCSSIFSFSKLVKHYFKFFKFQGIYLFCKQIEFFLLNEINYKYLYYGPALKEENFMKNLSIKAKIQLINMLLILHKLIFGSLVVLYYGQAYYMFLPLIVIILNLIYNIKCNYSSYQRVKNFYHKLDIL